jgi:hypothetical protein
MLTTLVLVSSLSLAPAQAGELKLVNPRATHGVLGAVRKTTKVLPGDVFFLTFDIDNLTADDEGKVLYSMGMELINPKGETEYKRDPQEKPPIYNVLGGTRIPAFAHAQTSPDTPPGEYTLKVTVIDRSTKPERKAVLSQKFEVLKKAFGLVELTTSYDKDGILSAPFGGMAGQSLFVNFWIVGFERTKAGQPDISFEMRAYDDKDKPTVKKAIVGEIPDRRLKTDVPEDWQRIPMNFILPLNRPGKYTVTLKATDRISKKTAELSFPITVVELK